MLSLNWLVCLSCFRYLKHIRLKKYNDDNHVDLDMYECFSAMEKVVYYYKTYTKLYRQISL